LTLTWFATSPTSGRFLSGEVARSDVMELVDRFEQLRASGQGYIEVNRDDDHPAITLGFLGEHAVVHLMPDAESTSLLAGDGSSTADVVEVQIMDDLAEFTGDVVLSLDHAWAVVQQFVRTGDVSTVGEWHEL
jgi:hypothetical protein